MREQLDALARKHHARGDEAVEDQQVWLQLHAGSHIVANLGVYRFERVYYTRSWHSG